MEASALSNAESWLGILWYFKLIAAGLVAVGVAFEFGGDWVSRPFEKTVEDARKLEILTLQKELEDSRKEEARLSAEAQAAKETIARANESAAIANERAAALQAKVVWRHLTDAQCRALTSILREKPRGISIEYPLGDPEALLFAITIMNCLGGGAGWQIRTSGATYIGSLPLGLLLSGQNEATAAVREALRQVGIPHGDADPNLLNQGVAMRSGMSALPDDAILVVGSRPVF